LFQPDLALSQPDIALSQLYLDLSQQISINLGKELIEKVSIAKFLIGSYSKPILDSREIIHSFKKFFSTAEK
jgi:hypothetical protein